MFFNLLTLLMMPTKEGSGGGGLTSMLIMFGAIFAIMYFLMIRPQQKRQKKHEAMLQSLAKGDKVVTAGGIYGLVQSHNEDKGTLILKIAENVKVEIKRSAIAGKVES